MADAQEGFALERASELELPRLERRLPKHVLTASEAELVLSQPDTLEPMGIRDRAILESSTGGLSASLPPTASGRNRCQTAVTLTATVGKRQRC